MKKIASINHLTPQLTNRASSSKYSAYNLSLSSDLHQDLDVPEYFETQCGLDEVRHSRRSVILSLGGFPDKLQRPIRDAATYMVSLLSRGNSNMGNMTGAPGVDPDRKQESGDKVGFDREMSRPGKSTRITVVPTGRSGSTSGRAAAPSGIAVSDLSPSKSAFDIPRDFEAVKMLSREQSRNASRVCSAKGSEVMEGMNREPKSIGATEFGSRGVDSKLDRDLSIDFSPSTVAKQEDVANPSLHRENSGFNIPRDHQATKLKFRVNFTADFKTVTGVDNEPAPIISRTNSNTYTLGVKPAISMASLATLVVEPDTSNLEQIHMKVTQQARGFSCGITTESFKVITDSDEFELLWSNMFGDGRTAPSKLMVDFDKEQVIALFLGKKPYPGFQIKVVKMKEDDKGLQIRYKVIEPGPGDTVLNRSSQPYHLIVNTKTHRKVYFQQDDEDSSSTKTVLRPAADQTQY